MRKRVVFFGLAFGGLVGAGLLVSGCGGGGGDKLVDPANADPLAHQALLVEADLPGTGWSVTKTDDFSDSGIEGDTAACKDISSAQATAKATSSAGRAGRAEKELSLDTGSPIPAAVETEINIFNDTSTPSDVLKLYQDAVKSSNFETCLKDVLEGSVGNGVKVDTKSVSPLASAPDGGTAVAYEFAFAIQGQNFALHYETYTWRSDNVGITVTVNGLKKDVTADVAKAAVSKTQSNVDGLPRK